MSIDEQELARELVPSLTVRDVLDRADLLPTARRLLAKYDITRKAPAEPVWPSDEQLEYLNNRLSPYDGWAWGRAALLRLIAEQVDAMPDGIGSRCTSTTWKRLSRDGQAARADDLKAIFGIRP